MESIENKIEAMSTLEEIKEQYCNETGFTSAKILHPYLTLTDKDWTIISKRFASQQVKEALERAAEKARLKMFEDVKPTPYELENSILSLIK